jgi:two-component system phosphate regulon sensor histidine kinase PhoR
VTLLSQAPDLAVRGDPGRLEQVLGNLVDNAIKYGRAGGTVTVGARPTEADEVEVSVQDDGPGIPPDALERIFERFYRVDKARSRDQGGTGLGLAIVKHLVQSHGGRVWASSRLNQGATFYFTLPRDYGAA